MGNVIAGRVEDANPQIPVFGLDAAHRRGMTFK
jgi:hypothetical protein